MHDSKPIRCLLVDDEPPAREILRRYIDDIATMELAAECSNALQAFTVLQKETIDLMFLDIRMPRMNGNDFLKSIKHPPKVIFTTAYPEYALEGYELDVVDYLLKPVPFDRFLKAVNKAFPTGAVPDEKMELVEKKKQAFVYFRIDRKMKKVMLDDIMYIESMKDYIKLFTPGGTLITKQSISSVEEMLPVKEFARVHRSYIVSLDHIKSFTAEVIEIGNTNIPIGKLYRSEAMKILQQV
jgi:two-component system LytT family response regulator